MDTTIPATRPHRTTHSHPWLALVFLIVVCQLAGALGILSGNQDFYLELNRPGWAPPSWLFGPVWIALYTMIGLSAWLVWREPPSRRRTQGLTLFTAQLALNAVWTPIFFGFEAIGVGLLVIATLTAAIFATIVVFGKLSQPAAWLLVPYIAWVGFATALNAALYQLN